MLRQALSVGVFALSLVAANEYPDCEKDNCYNNFLDSRFADEAPKFCFKFLSGNTTAPSAIPTEYSNCKQNIKAVSSACSCITYTATHTSSVPSVTPTSTPKPPVTTSSAKTTSTAVSSKSESATSKIPSGSKPITSPTSSKFETITSKTSVKPEPKPSTTDYSTITISTTQVNTITSCPPKFTTCPGRNYTLTTITIPAYTTVCPITTSTVYSTTSYTITQCPKTITNCPVGSVTISSTPISTTKFAVITPPAVVPGPPAGTGIPAPPASEPADIPKPDNTALPVPAPPAGTDIPAPSASGPADVPKPDVSPIPADDTVIPVPAPVPGTPSNPVVIAPTPTGSTPVQVTNAADRASLELSYVAVGVIAAFLI